MIKLISLLFEDEHETGSVWRTERDIFGAKNAQGFVRYFADREKAAKFASGEIKGPHPGKPVPRTRPEPKQHKEPYAK